HRPMLATLTAALPDAMQHEVRFPPARDGHGMVGSGMFIVNPPWGLRQGADQITHLFEGRNAQ
ncbi:MAG: 23S rRNA (adenine(2030)-N(6))-methyltransferase RlmJ, partial [Pseudomonadota bacterium]